MRTIHREIKQIVRDALTKSNECASTTTSDWVRVRIMAAKTYLFERKFGKAIHIMSDLWYVIPPDMLKIGGDSANITLYDYDENSERIEAGGIRFCNQILHDTEQELEQDESPFEPMVFEEDNAGAFQDDFRNRIFVDRDQENEMLNDFQESVGDPSLL